MSGTGRPARARIRRAPLASVWLPHRWIGNPPARGWTRERGVVEPGRGMRSWVVLYTSSRGFVFVPPSISLRRQRDAIGRLRPGGVGSATSGEAFGLRPRRTREPVAGANRSDRGEGRDPSVGRVNPRAGAPGPVTGTRPRSRGHRIEGPDGARIGAGISGPRRAPDREASPRRRGRPWGGGRLVSWSICR